VNIVERIRKIDMKSNEFILDDSNTEKAKYLSKIGLAIKDLLPLAVEELNLTELPKIKPVMKLPNEESSFGSFSPVENCIYFVVGNRHPIDILRTLAHELVHVSQRQRGQLDKNSGETGSEEENQANAIAGVIMRKYAEQFPDRF